MSWLFINGSPRRDGNTSYLLGQVREAFGAAEGDWLELRAYEAGIGPCVDCRACKSGALECALRDGMTAVYRQLEAADVIVVGSPIYWSGVAGPVKDLLDRLRPYYKSGRLRGKRFMSVSVGASGEAEADLMAEAYRRIAGALGMEILGQVSATGFDPGDAEREGWDGARIAARIAPVAASPT